MNTATEEKHAQKLEELVQDDDKIVTIPSIANVLNIPIQSSERLISKYVDEQRKLRPKDLSVTYILTGSLKDKGKAVMIVKEDDLKVKRNLFNNIDSEILFSVQKYKQVDFNAVALTNDFDSEGPLLGSFVSNNCVKRILKTKKFPTPPPPTIKGKSSFFIPKSESSSSIDTSKSKQNGTSSMASMFSKNGTKKNEKEVVDKKTAPIKSKGALSSFLSKGASPSYANVKTGNGIQKQDSNDSQSQISGLEELMDVDFKEFDEEIDTNIKKVKKVEETKSDAKEEKKKDTKKSEGKDKKSKSKRQREKSEEKNVKKRKRIVERNDSDSDDMFEKSEDGDVIDASDGEMERVPSPVPKKPLAPKNKVRKAVDKTYVDDEGFIVTKTEYVYESAPEDDDIVPVKAQEEKPKIEKKNSASSEHEISPKDAKGKKKGKKNNMQNQPTLMNFFKKK